VYGSYAYCCPQPKDVLIEHAPSFKAEETGEGQSIRYEIDHSMQYKLKYEVAKGMVTIRAWLRRYFERQRGMSVAGASEAAAAAFKATESCMYTDMVVGLMNPGKRMSIRNPALLREEAGG
jgi:hypothetical protein